nr:MAG TPA: hypothetical protein [Caudoviricetes sp.]
MKRNFKHSIRPDVYTIENLSYFSIYYYVHIYLFIMDNL